MSHKEIIYITDNALKPSIQKCCQEQLRKAAREIPIISISQKPIPFGRNICIGTKFGRHQKTIFKQIDCGLDFCSSEVLFIAEHDVLYPEEYFDFEPQKKDVIYYQGPRRLLNYEGYGDKMATGPLSCCCGHRQILKEAFQSRKEETENGKFFSRPEPGATTTDPWRTEKIDKEFPVLDIRHGNNFTGYRECKTHETHIPYWGDFTYWKRKLGLTYHNVRFRFDIIRRLINQYRYQSYLEIGVRDPKGCFDRIRCKQKEGIDPKPVSTYQMTSDEFFVSYPDKKYDLIFIDGCHEERQVLRDMENAQQSINEGGTIVMHDCNPPSAGAESLNVCGTVWRAFIRWRATQPNLEMFVVDTDYGVGVIRQGKQQVLNLNGQDLTYTYLEQNRKKALNLISPVEFMEILKRTISS